MPRRPLDDAQVAPNVIEAIVNLGKNDQSNSPSFSEQTRPEAEEALSDRIETESVQADLSAHSNKDPIAPISTADEAHFEERAAPPVGQTAMPGTAEYSPVSQNVGGKVGDQSSRFEACSKTEQVVQDAPVASSMVAPVIGGEKEDGFRRLESSIRDTLRPADPIEESWVQDLSDNIWQRCRLRRLREGLYASTYPVAVVEVMKADHKLVHHLRWKEDLGMKALQDWMKNGFVTDDMINSKTLQLESENFEMLDRMLEALTKRHILIMREIREHRTYTASAAQAIAGIVQKFEEGQFTEVASASDD